MRKYSAVLLILFIFAANLFGQEIFEKAKNTFKPIPQEPPAIKGNPLTDAKIKLGKYLYFDPRLSKSALISCNTCHNVGLGGSDYQKTGTGHAWQHGPRNDPTTFNAVFNSSQFWDGRAKDLAEQAKGPLSNPVEMASDEERIIKTLKSMPEYVDLFKKAFPDAKKAITLDNVAKAIEAFEATLVTPDSKFDKFLRGDKSALNEKELSGLKAFFDYGCESCHGGLNMGGTSLMKFGLVEMPSEDIIAGDMGRYEVTKKESDKYVFKVPTLRNVALTSPYFHSGTVWELAEAVKIMAKTQVGVDLSENETDNIVSFLKTLTGKQPKIEYPILPEATSETPKPVHSK
ncbi:MAG: cytochrome-c peroxidase [Deferribacterota bacterium]|nr:cytochrome-c peroxidase [Deferribacterota bacterium]